MRVPKQCVPTREPPKFGGNPIPCREDLKQKRNARERATIQFSVEEKPVGKRKDYPEFSSRPGACFPGTLYLAADDSADNAGYRNYAAMQNRCRPSECGFPPGEERP